MRTYFKRVVATAPVLVTAMLAACADSVTTPSQGHEAAAASYDRGMSLHPGQRARQSGRRPGRRLHARYAPLGAAG